MNRLFLISLFLLVLLANVDATTQPSIPGFDLNPESVRLALKPDMIDDSKTPSWIGGSAQKWPMKWYGGIKCDGDCPDRLPYFLFAGHAAEMQTRYGVKTPEELGRLIREPGGTKLATALAQEFQFGVMQTDAGGSRFGRSYGRFWNPIYIGGQVVSWMWEGRTTPEIIRYLHDDLGFDYAVIIASVNWANSRAGSYYYAMERCNVTPLGPLDNTYASKNLWKPPVCKNVDAAVYGEDAYPITVREPSFLFLKDGHLLLLNVQDFLIGGEGGVGRGGLEYDIGKYWGRRYLTWLVPKEVWSKWNPDDIGWLKFWYFLLLQPAEHRIGFSETGGFGNEGWYIVSRAEFNRFVILHKRLKAQLAEYSRKVGFDVTKFTSVPYWKDADKFPRLVMEGFPSPANTLLDYLTSRTIDEPLPPECNTISCLVAVVVDRRVMDSLYAQEVYRYLSGEGKRHPMAQYRSVNDRNYMRLFTATYVAESDWTRLPQSGYIHEGAIDSVLEFDYEQALASNLMPAVAGPSGQLNSQPIEVFQATAITPPVLTGSIVERPFVIETQLPSQSDLWEFPFLPVNTALLSFILVMTVGTVMSRRLTREERQFYRELARKKK